MFTSLHMVYLAKVSLIQVTVMAYNAERLVKDDLERIWNESVVVKLTYTLQFACKVGGKTL